MMAERDHEHEWRTHTRIARAPIDPADPVAHTSFLVLGCACGLATVFPAFNFLLVTREYRARLTIELARDGLRLAPTLDTIGLAELRDAVAHGAGHACDEWQDGAGHCLLCDANQ